MHFVFVPQYGLARGDRTTICGRRNVATCSWCAYSNFLYFIRFWYNARLKPKRQQQQRQQQHNRKYFENSSTFLANWQYTDQRNGKWRMANEESENERLSNECCGRILDMHVAWHWGMHIEHIWCRTVESMREMLVDDTIFHSLSSEFRWWSRVHIRNGAKEKTTVRLQWTLGNVNSRVLVWSY